MGRSKPAKVRSRRLPNLQRCMRMPAHDRMKVPTTGDFLAARSRSQLLLLRPLDHATPRQPWVEPACSEPAAHQYRQPARSGHAVHPRKAVARRRLRLGLVDQRASPKQSVGIDFTKKRASTHGPRHIRSTLQARQGRQGLGGDALDDECRGCYRMYEPGCLAEPHTGVIGVAFRKGLSIARTFH